MGDGAAEAGEGEDGGGGEEGDLGEGGEGEGKEEQINDQDSTPEAQQRIMGAGEVEGGGAPEWAVGLAGAVAEALRVCRESALGPQFACTGERNVWILKPGAARRLLVAVVC